MEWLFKKAEEFLRRHKFIRRWRKVLAVMMAMVVFMSTYAMVLPAITLETGEGAEIGLFADTSGDESVPDGSTVTDSIPEAGAEGAALTTETAVIEDTAPAETAPVENVPTENAPAENTPAEPEATETAPTEAAPTEAVPTEAAPTEAIPTEAAPTSTETPAPKVENLVTPEEPKYLENEKLTFENNSIKLTLTVPAAAKVVKGAAIDVREIGQPFANDGLDENGRKNEYLSYLAAAETALNLTAEEITYIEKNIVNTPAAELPWARFFAISIKNADGAIAPACALPVEIIYKNTAETAADGLKVMCLLPNGTMTMIGSETKVATAAQTPIALLSAADSNFDITSKFVDAGTLTFGTFAVQVSEIDAAIEKEKEEAAKAAAEAAKAESTLTESASGTESVPAESSAAPVAESSVAEAAESSAAETAESSATESVPAEDASVSEFAEPEESLPEDASEAESAEESLPAEAEDESLVEEAEKAEEKTEIQEQPKADDKVTKTLVTKGADYTVTMTYTADAKIPAGAVLSAKEILSTAYNYKGYFNKAADALNLSDEQKSNTYARFFDIKILLGNSEVTPAVPVQVEITYNKPQEKSANAEMNAVHFSKEGPEVIAAETTQADAATGEVNAVGFEAGSFSVYGVVYTVDFEYFNPETGERLAWSTAGEGEYRLTSIMSRLGIAADIVSASLVKTVDEGCPENALYLEQRADGWYLVSETAFADTFELSISAGNKEYVIIVRDAAETTNLSQLITNAQLTGATPNENGGYTVKPGITYGVDFTFTESESTFQFSNTQEMYLPIPDGLTLGNITSPFDIMINYLGNNVTVTGNTAKVENGQLVIKINDDPNDPNVAKLRSISTAQIKVHAQAVFDSSQSGKDITIPGGGTYHVDGTTDVTITKSGRVVDFDKGEVEYTLNLTSNGSNSGITVKDELKGTAFTGYDTTKQIVLKKDGQVVKSFNTPNGKSFEINTGALDNGNYQIVYTAKIDKSRLTEDGNALGVADDTKNTVTYLNNKTTEHNLGHIVEARTGWKGGGNSTTTDDGQAINDWTITAYTTPLTDGQLTEVSDHIITPGVEYYGTGFDVKITDVTTGNVVAEKVHVDWPANKTDNTWSYDMSHLPGYPNAGKYWKYDITYKTVTDMSQASQSKEIVNEGGPEGDKHQGTGHALVPEGNRTGIEKKLVGVNDQNEVTWRIKLTIPALGVSDDKSFVTEKLPSSRRGYKDTYVDGSFAYVEGSSVEPIPQIIKEENGDITFKWNGFAASSGKRYVIFTFKTKFDPSWITDERASKIHRNEAVFNGDSAFDNVTYAEPLFEKVGSTAIIEDGAIYFDFDVKTNKLTEGAFGTDGTDSIVFTDKYDSRLEYVAGSAVIYGGESENNIDRTNSSAVPTYAVGDAANTMTFTVTKDMLPRKFGQREDGSWGELNELCTYYRIHYRMKVTDADALTSQALLLDTMTVKMGNKITSDIGEKETEVEYTPKVLDKWQSQAINSDTTNHKGKVQFTIHVNESQLDLVDGDVLTLTDTLTNISTAYQDIQISFPKGNYEVGDKTTTIPETGKTVNLPYFNMKNDTVTFYLPDGVDTLITYWAKPTGEVGADGKIHYTNTAKLKNYEKKVEESADWSGDASGLATQFGVKLYKADAYENSKYLAGAEFKLFMVDEEDENGNIISGTPMKDKSNKDVIFTTLSDGVISIEGDEMQVGWNLKPEQRYYLLEVKAPTGYAIDSTKYSFIISANGYTNYTGDSIVAPDGSGAIVKPWTFYNGDVVTVKNKPIKGQLEITKNFDQSGDVKSYAEMSEDQKAAITFEVSQKQKDDSWKVLKNISFAQFTVDGSGVPKFLIGDLEPGEYRVREIINGDTTCKEQHYQITLDQDAIDPDDPTYVTINITQDDINNNTVHFMSVANKYVDESEFKLYKYANRGAEGKTDVRLAGAEFGVFTVENGVATENQIGDNHVTNGKGQFSLKPSNDPNSGLQYNTYYALKEMVPPDGYKKSEKVIYFWFRGNPATTPAGPAPENVIAIDYKETHTEMFANDIGTTSIGVKKIWQNEQLMEDTNKTDSVQVKIYRKATLDKEGKNISQEYSGYYPTDKDFPEVLFEAKWNGQKWILATTNSSQGAVADEGLSIVDGRLTGLPKMMITDGGIPLYYHYSVEEVVPANYVASYDLKTEDDGSPTVEITNRPTSVRSFVKLEATKKWENAEHKDVTSSISAEKTIKLDVYRQVGAVKEGIIREKNGEEKSAAALFPIIIEKEASHQGGPISITPASIVAMPGDLLRITLKPEYDETTEITPNKFEVKVGSKPDGTNFHGETKVVDINEDDQGVITFEANTANNVILVRSNDSKMKRLDIEIENVTAEGRTQILTQAEADSVGGTYVETLTLERGNNWHDSSKELSGGSGNDVYSYYLVEQDGADYDASYTVSGEKVTVTNIDKNLRVDKKWVRPDGETELEVEDGSIDFDVYRITNGSQKWIKDQDGGSYSQTGTLSVVNAMYPVQNNGMRVSGDITVSGDYQKIRAGSKIKIVISSQKNDSNIGASEDVWAQTKVVITGGTVESDVTVKPNYEYEERTIVVKDVTSSVKLSGPICIGNDNGKNNLSVVVTVLEEYQPTADSTETPLGRVTLTKTDATSTNEALSVKSGGKWSAVISNLPASGKAADNSPETYTYRIEEVQTSIPENFEYVSVSPAGNVTNASEVVITNKAKPAKVRITKSFEGINSLPEAYKITNSANDTEFTVANKTGGTGTKADPYYWELDGLIIGEEVTFYEWNFGVEGMEMTVQDMHGNEITSPYKTTVTAVEEIPDSDKDTPGVTGFVNNYGALTGNLAIKKAITGDRDVSGKDFTFEVELKNSDATPYTGAVTVTDKTRIAQTVTVGETEKITVTVTGTGTATLADIPVGVTYVVTEPARDPADGWVQDGEIVYSDTTKTIASHDEDTATVTNKYEATGSVDFKVEKNFNGGTFSNEKKFEFRLSQVTDETGTTVAAEGDVGTGEGKIPALVLAESQTVDTTDLEGSKAAISFESGITFDLSKVGTYYFLIEEIVPEEAAESPFISGEVKYPAPADAKKVITVTVEDGEAAGKPGKLIVKKDGVEYDPENAEADADATFTNEQITDFEAYKIWHDLSSREVAWGDAQSITVTVGRKAGDDVDNTFSYTYVAPKTAFTAEGTDLKAVGSSGSPNAPVMKAILVQAEAPATIPQYKLYMKDLLKADGDGTTYSYFVTETKVNGYKNPLYGDSNGTVNVKAENASDGGCIVNKPDDSVELPSTGGPGTLIFTMLGMMLIAFAGTAYMILLRRRKASLKGGGNPR